VGAGCRHRSRRRDAEDLRLKGKIRVGVAHANAQIRQAKPQRFARAVAAPDVVAERLEPGKAGGVSDL